MIHLKKIILKKIIESHKKTRLCYATLQVTEATGHDGKDKIKRK